MELEDTAKATQSPFSTGSGPDGPSEYSRATQIGRYVLLDKLGAGGMGVVYAAYDPELDRKVALKMLLPSTAGDSESTGRIRMIREAQALAKLSHPNVVAVYDVGTAGDSIWIAMELVTGRTLGAWALTIEELAGDLESADRGRPRCSRRPRRRRDPPRPQA